MVDPADGCGRSSSYNSGARRRRQAPQPLFRIAIHGELGFGTVIWVRLFLLGVSSSGLWSILAGLLRFIPYVGTVAASLGPLALAAAVAPGSDMVIWVALLFVLVEPIVGYVVEPLLYGHPTGLSPVSVLIAALFWTWV